MQDPPDLCRSNSAFSVADGDRAAFGDFLLRARLASGLSIRQIAEQTKVCSRYLDALERGQIEVLPEGLYRRSILRAYATAVNLDATTALERLAVTFDPEVRQDLHETAQRPRSRQNMWNRRHTVAAAIVTVAVMLGTAVVLPVALREDEQEPQSLGGGASRNIAAPAADVALPASVATSGSVPSEPTKSQATSSTTLVVISSPSGARVTVDGVGWGTTPLTVPYLPPGIKVVRVTKDGYLSAERRVPLGGGDGHTSVQLELVARQ